MPGGRPTNDPKQTLVAVRLALRHLRLLEQRSRREGVGISEALRRCLDDWATQARSPTSPRARRPTAEEQKTFDHVFDALGLKPVARRRRPRRK